MNKLIGIFICMLGTTALQAQVANGRGNNFRVDTTAAYTVYNINDTAFQTTLAAIEFRALRTFIDKKEQKKYDKLVYAVRTTYPIAEDAYKEYLYYSIMYSDDAHGRHAALKNAEDALDAKFRKKLKKLSNYEAGILLRLIDKKTNMTSYDVIKVLKGGFAAWTWQIGAKMAGLNLKSSFSPYLNTEDKYIVEIVQMIESGSLTTLEVK